MPDQDDNLYLTQVPLVRPVVYHVRQPESNFGLSLLGVVTAATLYACVLLAVGLFLMAISTGLPSASLGEFFCACIGGLCIFIMSVVVALMAAVIPLAILSLGLCLTIARTLGTKLRWSIIGGFGGGLTGYLGTCWILAKPAPNEWGWLLGILLGPVLATLLGQAGGSWAALAPWAMAPAPSPYDENEPRSLWQFDIRQLMIATAWVAGILAVLKGLGALGVGSASVLFGGLVVQSLTLPLVMRAVKGIRQR